MPEEGNIEEVEKRKKTLEEEQKELDNQQAGTDAEDKLKLAVATAKRIEDGNKKYEELLAQEARMKTIDTLGGQSEKSEKPTKEDEEKKAARALLPEGMECPGVTD